MTKVRTLEIFSIYLMIVQELIATIDPNQNGKLNYDEFLLVLRYIEERQI